MLGVFPCISSEPHAACLTLIIRGLRGSEEVGMSNLANSPEVIYLSVLFTGERTWAMAI